MRYVVALLMMLGFCGLALAETTEPVRVGAKNFTEQHILGEIVAQLIERHTDLSVERRFGLGGTDICHAALVQGELDVYVEYTGTALLNVLKRPVINDPERAYQVVTEDYRRQFDLHWLPPIGFNNTYAITLRAADADRLGVGTIGDLRPHVDGLRGGFTSEFMERPDGYPGLSKAYRLRLGSTVDLDPGLMYDAIHVEQVDVICAFATDPRIVQYGLRVLRDDKRFFPPYDAAPVVRTDLLQRHPQVARALAPLAGTINDDDMTRMNHSVDVSKQSPARVAERWLDRATGSNGHSAPEHPLTRLAGDTPTAPQPLGVWSLAWQRRAQVFEKTAQHLFLTVLGLGIATAIGVPLGIAIHRVPAARGPVLAAIEVVQTIPSLAMLAFLFAVYGLLGNTPAVTALVLYALLPIVLNTFTGLNHLPPRVIEAAHGVGMSGGQRLCLVELPLAAPIIIAGIRAATVLTVGIATLCTYIGAGGLGDFIARGLARNDTRLTLLGAVPAAVMAVALSLMIRSLEQVARRG